MTDVNKESIDNNNEETKPVEHTEDKSVEKPKKTRGRPKKEKPPKPPRVLESIKTVDEVTGKEKYRQRSVSDKEYGHRKLKKPITCDIRGDVAACQLQKHKNND